MSTILDDALDETKPPTGNALTSDERAAKVVMNQQFGRAKTDIEGLEAHPGTGGAAHAAAIAGGANGFMTGADKSKLDGVAAGAEPNTVDSVFSRTGAVVATAGDYDGLYAVESTENETTGALRLAVVATLPGTPNADTIYFVTT